MGNPSRCPKCNRFGSTELDGYCKACYTSPNKAIFSRVAIESKLNPTVAKSAYLEIGKSIGDTITENEARIILQIIMRRKPVKRSGHLVRGKSPMESYGYKFNDEHDKYEIIKEVVDYERME